MVNLQNEEIINIYQEKLEKNNVCAIVRSIHLDDDICFNSDQREVLYSIQQCFKEDNNNVINSRFKECLYGKALIINRKNIPKIPPFKNFNKYYKKNFLDRLELLDNHFEINKIDNKDLKLIKNEILISYSDIIYLKKLPNVILNYIVSFLKYNYRSYKILRDKYEERRKLCK